ncbi:MAG: CehA/McbA family metallohydrolase [Planctomycetota bacterium]
MTVHEAGSAAGLPCRAWVIAGDERLFNPADESCTAYARDRSFSCDGHFAIKVPPGKAVIHVERGKECWPVDKEVVVEKDRTTNVDIALKRWVNMCEEGWYSSDIHCHFGLDDLRVLKQLALADDVNFEPILTLWNHQRGDSPDGAWPDYANPPSIYADATHMATLRNQEIERIGGEAFESVGALLMFGLQRPVKMPAGNSRYPCDAILGRMAKESSPQCLIDTDKPIWGENVIGVALGLFDSVQVCHNHYHRESTLQAGRIGWGMADLEDETENLTDDELFHRTNSTYYRFLNCGFKLAATGGSAMGVMAVPLGYSRTYAKLDGPLTEANYLEAIRAGRSFATSGPMLILTANGLDSGSEIRYSTGSSDPVSIKAELRSIQRIDSLELIANGQVIKSINLKNNAPSPILTESVAMAFRPQRSGWVAARAILTSPDGHLRQAHTSPVYITVDGKPTASGTDAEYMIRWIDRLLQVSEKPGRYQSDSERMETRKIFKEARVIYENITQRSQTQR